MKKGSLGTLLIGIIFLTFGITYLREITVSLTPADWQKVAEKQVLEYQTDLNKILEKTTREHNFGKITYEEWDSAHKDMLQRIQVGKKKIHLFINKLKSIDENFIFMNGQNKFYSYLLVTTWLIVTGLGLVLVFPWTRWFIYLSLCLSYFWQTYVYFYNRTVDLALQAHQTEISRLLNAPLPASVSTLHDFKTQIEILYTLIFLGMLYYFASEKGAELFKERKEFSFNQESFKEQP